MAEEYQNILYEKDGKIAFITINRPERMNAIDAQTSYELNSAFSEFRDDDALWVAILTGSGERAFSAGADIHEMARIAEDPNPPPSDPDRPEYSWHLAACAKPTIGVINGVRQPVIVHNQLRNVPEEAIYGWNPGAQFGVYRPDTFWFANAE